MEEACRGVKRLPGVERGRKGAGVRAEGKGRGLLEGVCEGAGAFREGKGEGRAGRPGGRERPGAFGGSWQGCGTASGRGEGKVGREASGRKGRKAESSGGSLRGRGGLSRGGEGEGWARVSGRKGRRDGFRREFARARGAFGRRERGRLGERLPGGRKAGASGGSLQGVERLPGGERGRPVGFRRKLAGVWNGFREGKGKAGRGRFRAGRGGRRKTPAPCKGRALESGGGG